MNRKLLFGVSVFLALVGIALAGGSQQASAGIGCRGCAGLFASHGRARCGGLFSHHRRARCGGDVCGGAVCGGREVCAGRRHHRRCFGLLRRQRCCGPQVCCGVPAPTCCQPVATCCGTVVEEHVEHGEAEAHDADAGGEQEEGEAVPDAPAATDTTSTPGVTYYQVTYR